MQSVDTIFHESKYSLLFIIVPFLIIGPLKKVDDSMILEISDKVKKELEDARDRLIDEKGIGKGILDRS